METSGLHVTIHAILRYAQRVERRDIMDDYYFVREERDRYTSLILSCISMGEPLPAQCCQFFVKPTSVRRSRSYHRAMGSLANETLAADSIPLSWGSYVFDGAACFVVERGRILTVIVPDAMEIETLESILENEDRAPTGSSSPLLTDPSLAETRNMLLEAADLIRSEHSDGSLGLPRPSRIEVLEPAWIPSGETCVNTEFVAMFLRWIGRVIPADGRPVLLLYDAHYRFFRHTIDLLSDHGLVARMNHPDFTFDALIAPGRPPPGTEDILEALRDGSFSHTFLFCTHNGAKAAIHLIRQVAGPDLQIHCRHRDEAAAEREPSGILYAFSDGQLASMPF
ncbi:MAG: hypothetical protein V1745_03470 [Patescibacteria group bacterium]